MKCTNFFNELNRIKIHEQRELKAALEAVGGEYVWEVPWVAPDEDEQPPVILVNFDNGPIDIRVQSCRLNKDGHIELSGMDNVAGIWPIDIDVEDVEPGHLCYVTEAIPGDFDVTIKE